jgi:hypothetical protein
MWGIFFATGVNALIIPSSSNTTSFQQWREIRRDVVEGRAAVPLVGHPNLANHLRLGRDVVLQLFSSTAPLLMRLKEAGEVTATIDYTSRPTYILL